MHRESAKTTGNLILESNHSHLHSELQPGAVRSSVIAVCCNNLTPFDIAWPSLFTVAAVMHVCLSKPQHVYQASL